MEKINYCTHCGNSLTDCDVDNGEIKCLACLSVLDASIGKVITQPVIAIDFDPDDYPEGFNSELYGL